MWGASAGLILRVDVVDHKLGEDLSRWGFGHCAETN